MRFALRLFVFLVSSIVLLPVATRAQANVGFDIECNHVALSVPNIAESIAWYAFAFISDNAGNAIELIEHKTH